MAARNSRDVKLMGNNPEITSAQRAVLDAEIAAAEHEDELFNNTPADALAELWQGLESIPNGRVRVTRKTATPTKPAGYMFSLPVDRIGSLDELLEKIANEYGGGDYKIALTNSSGQYLKNMQREIQIAEPIRKPEPLQQQQNAPQQGDAVSTLAQMLSAMQDNTRAMMDQMRDAQARQVESTNAILLQALTSRQEGGSGQSPTDMLAIFGMVKELMGGNKKDNGEFEGFMRGLEMGRELSGDNANESTFQTALKSLGEPLLAAVAAASAQQAGQVPRPIMPQQQPQIPQQQRIAPTPSPSIELQSDMKNSESQLTNSETQITGESEVNMLQIIQQWQPYIQILANAAALEADPDIYAELLLDQVEPDALDMVVMNDENYEKLFQYIPNLQQFRQWFDGLRKAVLDLREQDLLLGQDNGAESVDDVLSESGQQNVSG